jgi:hypothetical protein
MAPGATGGLVEKPPPTALVLAGQVAVAVISWPVLVAVAVAVAVTTGGTFFFFFFFASAVPANASIATASTAKISPALRPAPRTGANLSGA